MLLLYCVLFFFFKQKTAYELRISDWSSDVCSSDLLRIQREEMDGPHGIDDGDDPWKARDVEDAQRRQHQEINRHDGPEQRPDRKSVGEGKSVSVRVDLGGRRIIKQKTKYKRKMNDHTESKTNKGKKKRRYKT